MLASSLDGGDDNGFAGAGEIAGKKSPISQGVRSGIGTEGARSAKGGSMREPA
ncbi:MULTISPECIES: hypothetical protein [Pseudomonas]|uniref:Uncharacterized protein n=1 Tax=Pseudomonas piscis TaxID=2614538 RepID=A0ABY9NLB2_9PSED|nr:MULTISPECIES: hypothetical protein [Pseudomonas]WMN19359.1 hypothetical protein QL104_08100 [Pseudomonas piscis]